MCYKEGKVHIRRRINLGMILNIIFQTQSKPGKDKNKTFINFSVSYN